MISMMDHHLGLILDHLEATGQADNTIVVFTADHGDYLGHHGFRSKGLPAYDDVQRIPFIVRMPGDMQKAAGSESGAIVSQIDLAPTFLNWAGVEIPEAMQGLDVPEVLSGETDQGREEVVVELRPVRDGIYQKTLVTPDYKLVVYDHIEWGELYDRKADPEQLENLFDKPDYRDKREELTRRLIRCEMGYEARRPRRTSYA
jgi:arylsulfatase A-like enzyme